MTSRLAKPTNNLKIMNLTIQKLSKTYPNGVKAIDELTLEIKQGMFGLLGPNGAGKSSLMRTIATLQQPDSGSIHFKGINVLREPMELRKTLGYLPQEFGVYPKESAEKLLDYFAILKGVAAKKERSILVDEVLHLTNLYEVRKKHVSGYSGGMRQRFGIAQLLLNKPQLIIVDEPTAGLDPAERNRFLNVLRDIGSENIVIFSTHLVEDVRELCTQLAIMDQGRILRQTSPTDAIKALKGKIWVLQTDKAGLSLLKQKQTVLSSSFNEDHSLSVRVYAPEIPNEHFHAATPTLEDVYFTALKRNL